MGSPRSVFTAVVPMTTARRTQVRVCPQGSGEERCTVHTVGYHPALGRGPRHLLPCGRTTRTLCSTNILSRAVGPSRRGPPTRCPARGGCGAQGQAWGHGTLGDRATGSPFLGARAAVVQAASQRTRLWPQMSTHGARRACPLTVRPTCCLHTRGPRTVHFPEF